jgi:two-component system, response regulator FlrC
VEPLANYFIQKYCELNHTEKKILSSEALNALLTHQWTGNVRELENSIHRAVLMAQNEVIMPDDIFGQNGVQSGEINIDSAGSGPILVGRRVAEVERELILHTVDHCLGNRTHAANILGISIRTLRNKLKEYSDTGYISENQA